MKQLMDLLDQIAGAASQDARTVADGAPPPPAGEQQETEEVAPRNRSVAATARAAIDAMRRGVIAYTTLTDLPLPRGFTAVTRLHRCHVGLMAK